MDTTNAKVEGLFKDAAGHVKEAAGNLTGDAKLQATGKMDQLAGKAERDFADLYDAGETRIEAATAFIQERPLVSLGIATVVGLIVGGLLRRRRR
ncbi:CsbD family protein [Oecophyllibacter saccharovorans]|uniref:CsbD family protein n=1 Tax=Oecophyllibacter saccharovorans TaxID=2558360 RepID=A0A506URL0_9PROT|nr:CsbD family protein [Oecophyllibacter saccharovorans]QDH14780.1 CsbD family protein [Oecophyllibacter saccharovorans]TPW34979.1 CsbD family protein [Oecophyllibacter saccharovorans]TPW35919.1 CsbD family protein [Oecophyllibacter saccharovorans]